MNLINEYKKELREAREQKGMLGQKLKIAMRALSAIGLVNAGNDGELAQATAKAVDRALKEIDDCND